MGLFDSFSFDPTSYQGSGGLLSQLIPQALWNAQPQDQPTSYGSYGGVQYPIFGQPDPQAAIPQGASPVQYQPQPYLPQSPVQGEYGGVSYPLPGQQSTMGGAQPQMPQQATQQQGMPELPPQVAAAMGGQPQSGGFGDRLSAGLQGFANGGALLPALSNLFTGLSTGQRADATGQSQQMMRAQYESARQALIDNGWSPAQASSTAMASVFNPEVAKTLLGGAQTSDIKEYEYAKKSGGFNGTFADWMANKRAGAGEYSLTPVYGTDKDGKTVLIQPGKTGTAIQTKLPEGVNISSGIEKVDLGTQWGIMDKRTGNIVSVQPKDLRGAEREKGIGEQQGKEVSAASGDIRAGQNALAIVDKISAHPGLERGTGLSAIGNFIPGTLGKDFENLVQGAKSGAFLTAIQQMRGLGSLSNAEGDAATRAISRMDTATSKEAFLDALADYRKVVEQGIARSKARLANPSATTTMVAPQGTPADPLGIR